MNREQRLNRPKRLRLAMEKSGNGAKANHKEAIEVLAKDKTPKAQRVGNFFVKIKQGVRQQHINVVPRSKLYNRKAKPGLFATYWDIFKAKFGFSNNSKRYPRFN